MSEVPEASSLEDQIYLNAVDWVNQHSPEKLEDLKIVSAVLNQLQQFQVSGDPPDHLEDIIGDIAEISEDLRIDVMQRIEFKIRELSMSMSEEDQGEEEKEASGHSKGDHHQHSREKRTDMAFEEVPELKSEEGEKTLEEVLGQPGSLRVKEEIPSHLDSRSRVRLGRVKKAFRESIPHTKRERPTKLHNKKDL